MQTQQQFTKFCSMIDRLKKNLMPSELLMIRCSPSFYFSSSQLRHFLRKNLSKNMQAVMENKQMRKAKGQISSSSIFYAFCQMVQVISLKCAQGREITSGQKVNIMADRGRSISLSSAILQQHPRQLARKLAGMQMIRPANQANTIFIFDLQLLKAMQVDEEEIYTTLKGSKITPTQVEQRTLKNKTVWKIELDERWQAILAGIESSGIKILEIKWQEHRKIFKIINSIDFTELIQLNLSEINLPTSQPLISLKMPRLECLRLCHNNLTNIRSFRKLNFPQLRELLICNKKLIQELCDQDDNTIMDCNPLFEISSFLPLMIVISKQIKRPMEYRRTKYYRNPSLQNYTPLFKLRNNIEFSILLGPEYLNASILTPKFLQKYSKINQLSFDQR